MAQIPTRTPTHAGLDLDLAAAAADDTAACGTGQYSLLVNNGSASDVDVTIAVDSTTSYGVASPAKVITVPAGELWMIPLLSEYRDPDDGLAHIAWEATTDVTRVVVKH